MQYMMVYCDFLFLLSLSLSKKKKKKDATRSCSRRCVARAAGLE